MQFGSKHPTYRLAYQLSHKGTGDLSSVAKLCPSLCDPHRNCSKNTGMGGHFFLQGIFQTHRSNLSLLHWQADSLQLSRQGRPQLSLLPILSIVYREELMTMNHPHQSECHSVLGEFWPWAELLDFLCSCGNLWAGPPSPLVSALPLNFFQGSCSLPVMVQIANLSHITAWIRLRMELQGPSVNPLDPCGPSYFVVTVDEQWWGEVTTSGHKLSR